VGRQSAPVAPLSPHFRSVHVTRAPFVPPFPEFVTLLLIPFLYGPILCSEGEIRHDQSSHQHQDRRQSRRRRLLRQRPLTPTIHKEPRP
jgi:hypothetical protein